MRGRGHQIFAEGLARFAAAHADSRVTAVAERAAAPLRVAVHGRPGVGRGTVARALGGAGRSSGIAITTGAADLFVYVTAEVFKPEDVDAIAAARRPVVGVLNKADLIGPLSGWDDGAAHGPLAAARRRCAELSTLAGVAVRPMIGLLTVAAMDDLDGGLWAALRTLADHPGACLDGTFAQFLSAQCPVPTEVRVRLLDRLDLFGVALATAAIRQGRTPGQVRALLRRMGGADDVVRAIAAAGAELRYRRVLDAVAELEALAVPGTASGNAERITAFLAGDEAVVARMAAAADMAEAAGLEVGAGGGDRAAHLRAAARWQRYSRGAICPVRRACGADIARGTLRLWSRALPGEGA
ncbi:hypothetical protein [Mycobacterium sp. 050134]|uniref:hypothetical protein n=1 Tax=Mycobacterium sp. 050134 TaxID=3096111 RepID=UPI002ED85812